MNAMLEVTTGWLEQYVSALVLLNLMLGQTTATTPIQKPSPESIVRTLNEIAHGLYRPSRHFTNGGPRLSFHLERKELVATESYTVIVLNATTPESEFVSVNTGGVIFEDPAWAVFAAEGVAQGKMFGVPIAGTDAELWSRLPQLEKAVQESKYTPSDFFSPITGFTNPSTPSFSLLQVSGAELTALRTRGIQSFGKPTPKFYVLFKPHAAHH